MEERLLTDQHPREREQGCAAFWPAKSQSSTVNSFSLSVVVEDISLLLSLLSLTHVS